MLDSVVVLSEYLSALWYIIFFFFQSYIERGLFAFTYGSKDNRVDFVHVDNLVLSHVLAGLALTGMDPKAVSV